ncbi:MAG: hypothetical protein H6916_03990 [Novosphingobium sp.]|uniref:DnaA N-terminal domain-containing protein n=1 Tax=Novosphingobium sp. TaxID=1874826 RepID=UPI00261AC48D|nr:DnaA N-terminal domain-containing protein [Novosphingobium sp.]MCP5385962.1 hypothetical protein [Novosphingobium sp.]
MSAETSAWAKEQQCGDRTVKAVLCEIANWASPDGVVKFLHIKRIAEVVEVTPRTVKRCLARLEEPTLEHPDRLGLIRRVMRFRDDGGQSASGFELIGYQPPFARPPGDILSPPHDASVTPPGDKMSREGVTPVSPLNRDKNTIPPLSADADKTPAADFDDRDQGKDQAGAGQAAPAKREQPDPGKRQARGTRLPEDWSPPPIADLPPLPRKLVEQWPAGAYEAVCETFRLHWHSETRAIGCKRDWTAALGKWLISDHAKIMRDAKAGVSFAHLALARPAAGAKAAQPRRPVAAKAREDERSAAMHAALRRDMGDQLYQTWIEGTAMIHDAPGVIVIVASEFQRSWIEDRFQQKVQAAARAVMGSGVRWVRFQVEQQQEGQARQ